MVFRAASTVFPTCVGVFLTNGNRKIRSRSLPHVRGGVSRKPAGAGACPPSSPRAWGCFQKFEIRSNSPEVFPTCVGVFPHGLSFPLTTHRLPHVRGGVSHSFTGLNRRNRSSPRAWGCFSRIMAQKLPLPVFPTCVGVFLAELDLLCNLQRLPHVRGGVSNSGRRKDGHFPSSPRAWGCFL